MNHSNNHDKISFLRQYIWSEDHKIIAKQFLVTAVFMAIVGGLLALFVRWQLAWPYKELPFFGKLLWPQNNGSITPDVYNMLFTMHATIMIFFVIIPTLNGVFGNFLIPLQIGYKDMAFPFINALSYWLFAAASVIMIFSFFVHGGAASAGWTSYPPLSSIEKAAPGSGIGQTLWLTSLLFVGTSSILGAINYITTIVNCRAPGMKMTRLPLAIWGLFIASIVVLLVTPVLTAAFIMLLMDKTAGTSFFIPAGLKVGGALVEHSGGQPLLYQHLFWFYSHPAVYVMILPVMGIISDIVSCFSRKPVFGYHAMVISISVIAGLGLLVWGHHMFQSGMNPLLGTSFMISTMMIALPSSIKVFNWLATLWRGNIHFTSSMLHAIGFISMFIIGGLSGIFMANTPVDIFIHDTYFIVAHIHYVLFGGSLFGIFAGIYFWFPKMFGKMLNETLGKIHFFLTFIFLNLTFFPMHILGLGGMMRRIADPTQYEFLRGLQPINVFITYSAMFLGAAQLLFVANLLWSLFFGKKASANPWKANTLEWTIESPPGHGNFHIIPVVYNGPYEYSHPNTKEDYLPQTQQLFESKK